ncbi:HAMP domain-containing sensor histidine kinase [Phenylobacterium sp.]|uniref:sensor histidine kinase n=1 Tax=Phenylobacterium sp. TaxID=1871053 RepID=UPI002ED8B33C
MTGKARPPIAPESLALRDQVLVNEARTEMKGSLAAWIGLAVVTAFLAFEFAGKAEPVGYVLWLGTITAFLTGWLISWIRFVRRPPGDEAILAHLIPRAKAGMTLCNIATAGSVWVFLPAAGPELRALLLVLYAWYLIVQFAAATEATQVLKSAVVLVLGSLIAWLLVARPPYFLPLSLFLLLFGATLIAIRRFVREAVTTADAARRELAAALVSLERERDAKTHFIRAASHDLQQPLQAASLFLDRVKPGGRAGDQARSLGGLRQALTAARALVASMLEHLKLEGGAVRPDMTALAAGEVFDRVLLTQGPAAAAAGVRISTVGRRIALRADPLLLARALENLVANAIRHSGGRRILLGARARAGEVTIWVVDDGRGLAAGDAARIFSPFEQGAHVGEAGGFGLGLASTQGLVALMDGTCGVQAGLTQGAAFYIRLSPAGADRQDDVRCAA